MYRMILLVLLLPVAFAQNKCLEIKLQGAPANLNNIIYSNLKTNTQNLKRSDNIINDVEKSIKTSLQTQGYFNASIKSRLIRKKCTKVIANIKPGIPTKFSSINISCNNHKCPKNLLQNIPIKLNQQFSSRRYNNSLNFLLRQLHNTGYIYANVNQSRLIIRPKTHQAIVYFKVIKNKKVSLALPIITTTSVDHALIYKIIKYSPNQPFSLDWIEKAQVNLMNSGYFDNVDLQYTLKNHRAQVTIHLKDKKNSQKVISFGYDTETRLKVLLGVNQPLLNSLGHKIQTTGTIGEKERNINIKYVVPGYNPVYESWSLSSHYEDFLDLNFATVNFWTQSFSYNYNKKDTVYNLSINYSKENSLYRNTTTTKSKLAYAELQGLKKMRLISFWDTRPQLKLRWLLRLANQQYPESNWFQQYQLQLFANLPINNDNTIIVNLSHGKIITDNINSIPLSLQFSTGGQSLRGYLYNELGPSDTLNSTSFEYSNRISGPWHLGAFLDSAYINSIWGEKWFHGVGINLSWHSDLANVGFSIGRAISLPKRPFRIQLSVQV